MWDVDDMGHHRRPLFLTARDRNAIDLRRPNRCKAAARDINHEIAPLKSGRMPSSTDRSLPPIPAVNNLLLSSAGERARLFDDRRRGLGNVQRRVKERGASFLELSSERPMPRKRGQLFFACDGPNETKVLFHPVV